MASGCVFFTGVVVSASLTLLSPRSVDDRARKIVYSGLRKLIIVGAGELVGAGDAVRVVGRTLSMTPYSVGLEISGVNRFDNVPCLLEGDLN